MSLLKVILQAIRERRLPMIAWSGAEGTSSRCSRCRAPITLTRVAEGKQAFRCPSCGEEGVWKAEA
jgi:predicted RNA-binding Zn-ribbon protein involved in translation (DUF1610 family)